VITLVMRAFFFIVSSALGLVLTALLVPGFRITAGGFALTVLVFAVLQSVLAPFIAKVARRHATAFLGGVGIVSTFVALLLASTFTNGLRIAGFSSWVAATFLVWLLTAAATVLLPLVLFRRTLREARARKAGSRATSDRVNP
jgi:uncharacterized membrane protein YvlD (DUF360 family)